MQCVRVAAAVLNQVPLDWDGNRDRISQVLAAARAEIVDILCLPELCLTGYGCEDAFHSPSVWSRAWEMLQELLPACNGMVVSLGLPVRFGGALYNTACLVVDGRIVGLTAKRFLAGDGIHYEPRWFKPWPVGVRVDARVDGRKTTYPLGDLSYECGGVRIGFEICEDAWVANRPGADLARTGVDVVLNPSASHFAFGKIDVRRRFVLEGSRAFGATYIYSNLLGNEAGRAIYDGGTLIASGGKMIAEGPRFSFADWGLTSAVVDLDASRRVKVSTSSLQPNVVADARLCVDAEFQFRPQVAAVTVPQRSTWEQSDSLKEEEFTRAEALALFDYLRKSRTQGFVVSLSGGADSSAATVLVALMVKLAWDELGRETFLAKLRHISGLADSSQPSDVVRRLLTCVYQATRNSGQVTRESARQVTASVAGRFLELEIDPQVDGYVALVGTALKRELDWETDDIALQNIQARARAPGVWLVANLQNALLLATSNRSEAAVGYCTMDGDTCGSLNPLGGIDKHFLRIWLRWLEKTGPAGVGPLPVLAVVNQQSPTAELRPPAAGQTDESDLMPYELLDAIERAAIRDKYAPLETFQQMRVAYPEYAPRQLHAWVERFFQLWCRNQWKRERYAPSFHLDDENLDPKTWCRFPILSGNFDRELAELRQFVESEGAWPKAR